MAGAAAAGAIYYLASSSTSSRPPKVTEQAEMDPQDASPDPHNTALLTKEQILEFIQVFRKMYAADYKVM
jgi:hypothetical protein